MVDHEFALNRVLWPLKGFRVMSGHNRLHPRCNRTIPRTSWVNQQAYPTDSQINHCNVSIHNQCTTTIPQQVMNHHNLPTTGLGSNTETTLPAHPTHHELPTRQRRLDHGRWGQMRLDEGRQEKEYKALPWCSENLSDPVLKVIPWDLLCLCQTTSSSQDHMFACSHGDYLEPALTTLITLTTLDPYAYSTLFTPTLIPTLFRLSLLYWDLPILIDRLGYLNWSIAPLTISLVRVSPLA